VTSVTVTGVPVEDDSEHCVSVTFLALPHSCQWPCFTDAKQVSSRGRSIILKKDDVSYPGLPHKSLLSSPPSALVQNQSPACSSSTSSSNHGLQLGHVSPAVDIPWDITQRLLMQKSVMLVGHPGVGKSVEVGIVLFCLLRELAKIAQGSSPDGKLRRVYFRTVGVLYRFSIQGRTLQCNEIAGVGATLEDLTRFLESARPRRDVKAEDTILLLELAETETEPRMTWIPTLLALSTRGVLSITKTLCKTGVEIVIRPPHSLEGLIALATATYHIDGENFASGMGLDISRTLARSAKIAAVRAFVKNRIGEVGPLAREVLSDSITYERWVKLLSDSGSAKNFLLDLAGLSVYNLPCSAEYFVAPYGYLTRFLSSSARESIRRSVQQKDLNLLSNRGLDWQITEGVILDCFLMARLNSPTNYAGWEFYYNPVHEFGLTAADVVNGALRRRIVESCTGHHKKVYFSESILPLATAQLDPDAVYVRTVRTATSGELLLTILLTIVSHCTEY
jgi:hypothetical protein